MSTDKDRRSKEQKELLAVRVSEEIHQKIIDLSIKEHRPINMQAAKLIIEALQVRGEVEAA